MRSPNIVWPSPGSAVIRQADSIQFSVRPWLWPFAQDRRAEIDAYFAKLKAANPHYWNGTVLMFRDYAFAGTSVSGEAFETDYASFMAWHHWGWPDASVKNCFSSIALEGSDGGFLMGVMGAHTAGAEEIYFPCGTPDAGDILGGRVDFAGSAYRELLEETGIDAAGYAAEPGWTAVDVGPYLSLSKRVRAPETAEQLRERALAHLARDANPELSDILIVRKRADISAMMPPFIAAFLEHALSSRL